MKSSAVRILLVFLLLPACAFGANSVVNMSHYDLMRPDFAGMAREGIVGVIHEATFPRLRARREILLNGSGPHSKRAYYGELTTLATRLTPSRQADHFLDAVGRRGHRSGRTIRRNGGRVCCSFWISKKTVIIQEAQ